MFVIDDNHRPCFECVQSYPYVVNENLLTCRFQGIHYHCKQFRCFSICIQDPNCWFVKKCVIYYEVSFFLTFKKINSVYTTVGVETNKDDQ